MTRPLTVRHLESYLDSKRTLWIIHLTALAGLVALLGFLNANIVKETVNVWWVSPTYSHCFLIIPVSAYLVWRRRYHLSVLIPRIYPIAVLLMIPLLATLILGSFVSINELKQLSIIGLLQLLFLAVLGPIVYRKILFPCLYLFFLVPMGGYLIPPLQHFTTQFISFGLTLLGIVHHTDIDTIDLVNGRFEVAEACAGLRFLISTIAIGVLFVHFNYRRWTKIALYLVASVVVPVIGNGFRALGIVLLAYWSDNRIATGADHLIYGWGFSVAILVLLMFIGMRFSDRMPEVPATSPSSKIETSTSMSLLALLLTVAISAILICSAPVYLFYRDLLPLVFNRAALTKPSLLPGWKFAIPSKTWHPDYSGADTKLLFALRRVGSSSPSVNVEVYYYARSRSGHRLVSSTNKLWNERVWYPVAQSQADVQLGNMPLHFDQLEIATAGTSWLIWWTYWINGQFTTSGLKVKLDNLYGLFGDSEGSALIVLSTPIYLSESVARNSLNATLTALPYLPRTLASASHKPTE